MTNFCLFDLLLLMFLMFGVSIGLYAWLKAKKKLGLLCIVVNAILPTFLYLSVYYICLTNNLRSGSTWARLRAILQGYAGSKIWFLLIIFLYILTCIYEIWLLNTMAEYKTKNYKDK